MTTDTHEKILQVAAKLFVRQGYTATSVNQIAEEAGIGKATVYHHFPDKQAIIQAILDQSSSRAQSALAAATEVADPRRRIEAAAKASLGFLYGSIDLFQVVRREVPESKARLQTEFASFLRVYMTLLTDAIRQGVEQGTFRSADPADAARTLMAMLQGLYVQAFLGGDRAPAMEKNLDSMLDIFFRGIDA